MRNVRGALVEGEVAEGASSTRMDDSLGDTLMVESVDLGEPDGSHQQNGPTVDLRKAPLPSLARSGPPEEKGQSCVHQQL